MYLNYAKFKLQNYKKYSIYNVIFIITGVLLIFLVIGFRDMSTQKIKSTIIFTENAVYIQQKITNSSYPDGLEITDGQISDLESEFQAVSMMSLVDLPTSTRQHLEFVASTYNFIDTGVIAYDYNDLSVIVESIDLIYGKTWDENSDDKVVVIDEATAIILFGYSNVVGQYLPTVYDDLLIIGVVSNTHERQQLIDQYDNENKMYDPDSVATRAYVPMDYYKSVSTEELYNNIIVYDHNVSSIELELQVSNILEINDTLIKSYADIINREMIDNETYFIILSFMIVIFSILGLTNLINVTSFYYSIFSKNIAILRVVGANKTNLIKLSFIEGVLLGFIGTVLSIMSGFLILLVGSVFLGAIKYINFLYLIFLGAGIVLLISILMGLINVIILLIYYKKNFVFELQGENR